jgi:hypothetical protein
LCYIYLFFQELLQELYFLNCVPYVSVSTKNYTHSFVCVIRGGERVLREIQGEGVKLMLPFERQLIPDGDSIFLTKNCTK